MRTLIPETKKGETANLAAQKAIPKIRTEMSENVVLFIAGISLADTFSLAMQIVF